MKIGLNGTAVLAIAGLVVGGYVAWRAKNGLSDAVDWLTGLPGRVVDDVKIYAGVSGQEFQDQYKPNEVNRTNTAGSAAPVYNSPMVNDAGMDFRYF